MQKSKIDLYAYFREKVPESRKGGFLHGWQHGDESGIGIKKRPAVLIFPGGGYEFICKREREAVALEYYGHGFDAFVLDYDVVPLHYPTQIVQAGMAMLYLRREEKALNLNNKIAALGFSAGGHLCGCISFLWDDPALSDRFGKECEKIRPDAAVLSYPVVTSDKKYISHKGSFDNFCGNAVSPQGYSLENKVRSSAPPCFLWANAEDACVPVENSLLLYEALISSGVSAEIHIFEKGGHGWSLCNEEVLKGITPAVKHARRWVQMSVEFLWGHGFCPEA